MRREQWKRFADIEILCKINATALQRNRLCNATAFVLLTDVTKNIKIRITKHPALLVCSATTDKGEDIGGEISGI